MGNETRVAVAVLYNQLESVTSSSLIALVLASWCRPNIPCYGAATNKQQIVRKFKEF